MQLWSFDGIEWFQAGEMRFWMINRLLDCFRYKRGWEGIAGRPTARLRAWSLYLPVARAALADPAEIQGFKRHPIRRAEWRYLDMYR